MSRSGPKRISMENVKADPHARALTQSELDKLLSEPHMMRLSFLDKEGWPMVHPVWFLWEDGKLWTTVGTESVKARCLRKDRRAYFTIDTLENDRPLGVRGRAHVRVHPGGDERAMRLTRSSLRKYMGSEEGELATMLIDSVRSGETCAVELEPLKLASWSY